jgi:hypothetical protein
LTRGDITTNITKIQSIARDSFEKSFAKIEKSRRNREMSRQTHDIIILIKRI